MPSAQWAGAMDMAAPENASEYDEQGSGTGDIGDNTDKYQGVKQWDVRDIACTVGGVLVDDFVAFEFNNTRDVTHIETVREVVGYNLGYAKPTWAIHLRSTSDGMNELNRIRFEDRLVDIVFTAPCLMITAIGAIIRDIAWGTMTNESPEVVVSGLAMRIEEYVQDNQWIIQKGSISANQNKLYGKEGYSNGLNNDSEYSWRRRDDMTTQ